MRVVKCIWIDSVGYESWLDIEEKDNMNITEIITYGFLIREDKNAVYIAQSYAEDFDKIGHTTAIPRKAVKSIKNV